jgi:arsenate reductase
LGGEFVGCVMLMVVVVGSGLAAQALSPGDIGLELLENALAIGAGLFAIINIVGPVSGSHLNPIISLVDAWFGAGCGPGRSRTFPRRLWAALSGRSWRT